MKREGGGGGGGGGGGDAAGAEKDCGGENCCGGGEDGAGLYLFPPRGGLGFAAGGEDPAVVRRQLEAEVPMGRIGTVEDISGLVALLVSPRGRYITGTTIQVDGGLLRGVR